MTEDEWQYFWQRRESLTEGDWLSCPDSRPMIAFIGPKMSQRQHGLFYAAVSRKLWARDENESRRIAEAWERVAASELAEERLAEYLGETGDPPDSPPDSDWVAVNDASPANLRDIIGPFPFRSVSVDPTWLTSTVLTLAEGIYEERDFDRLPILGDALQDAGCDNADILGHCCSDGPHVRGCWVVDLVLGKT